MSWYVAQKAALETMSPELGKNNNQVAHSIHKRTEIKAYNKYQLEVTKLTTASMEEQTQETFWTPYL